MGVQRRSTTELWMVLLFAGCPYKLMEYMRDSTTNAPPSAVENTISVTLSALYAVTEHGSSHATLTLPRL